MTQEEISDLVAKLREPLRLIQFNGALGEDLNVINDVISQRTVAADLIESLTAPFKLRPMWETRESVKDKGTVILARFKAQAFLSSSTLVTLNGAWVCIHHIGFYIDRDMGWRISTLLSNVGFPDDLFEGWTYLPGDSSDNQSSPPDGQFVSASMAAVVAERDKLNAQIDCIVQYVQECFLASNCVVMWNGKMLELLDAKIVPSNREVIETPARVVRK
jgi:hypothetical protein